VALRGSTFVPPGSLLKSTKHSGIEVYPDERSDIGNSRQDHKTVWTRVLRQAQHK
jgi:hypothetical protein